MVYVDQYKIVQFLKKSIKNIYIIILCLILRLNLHIIYG